MNRILKFSLFCLLCVLTLASCSDEDDGGGFTSNMNTENATSVPDQVAVGLFEKSELRPLISPDEMENLAWSIMLSQPTYDYLQGMPHIKSEVGENDTIGVVHTNLVNYGKGDKQHWYLVSLVADTAEEHFIHAVELHKSADGDSLYYREIGSEKHSCKGTDCGDCTFDVNADGKITGCKCKHGGTGCNHSVTAVQGEK